MAIHKPLKGKTQEEGSMRRTRRKEIKLIDDKSKLRTTFTNRRHGLFKQTQQFCDSFDAEVAVITFSNAGNFFGFGHPDVNQVVRRYLADPTSNLPEGHADNGDEEEAPPLTEELDEVIAEAMATGQSVWDVMVRNLGLSELDKLEANIRRFKSMVAARSREVAAEDI
ncbi:hypothetical protein DH2020_028905 [Rehmannia glutinosa]|uniref:MADS-box domain-containing protein n=1 Tax=Rehmannia glutinosa TaxID=99300 RepID=A0ABR0VQ30_REHGL